MNNDKKDFFGKGAPFRQASKEGGKPEKRPVQAGGAPPSQAGSIVPPERRPVENKKLEPGMTGVLIKDANLRFDSYGSGRPDGQPTQTLKAGTAVTINNVVANPAAGQTHTVHVNGVGWIQADAIRV